MSRSAQEVLTDMLTAKAADANLAVLTNPSNVSLWYNLFGAVAVQISEMEVLGDTLLEEINERALEIPVGTLLWYAAETLQYQHGDTLIITDGIPSYAIDDPIKKIVKVASATEQSGAILIKAAKLDVNDNPIPLSGAELSGLQGYWINKRFAGAFLSVLSQAGDDMKAYLRIEVDGSIIAATGESQTASGVYPVEDAIKEYYRLLEFNGRFTVTDLIDAIQSVDGVKNSVVATDIQAKETGTGSYVNVMATDAKDYNPISGYIIEDTAFLLRNTLTYILI